MNLMKRNCLHQFLVATTILTILSLPICSCVKQEADAEESGRIEDRVSVFFSIEGEPRTTKAESLQCLDVLVFRTESGRIDSHLKASGSVFSVKVPKDIPVQWFIIANAPSDAFNNVNSLSDFNEEFSHLSDNTAASPCMSASGQTVFTQQSSQTATLYRLISRVYVGTIQNDYYEPTSFTVRRVFLLNAVEGLSFDAKRLSGFWYNKLVHEPSNTLSCLDTEMNRGSDSPLIEIGQYLYCFPNPTVEDVFSLTFLEWSPRHTRIVIEASVNGATEYYPITLPVMKRNTTYQLNKVIITGPGTAHPDTPIEREAIISTITILPWEYTELQAPLE